jgi:hypothetical protein
MASQPLSPVGLPVNDPAGEPHSVRAAALVAHVAAKDLVTRNPRNLGDER